MEKTDKNIEATDILPPVRHPAHPSQTKRPPGRIASCPAVCMGLLAEIRSAGRILPKHVQREKTK